MYSLQRVKRGIGLFDNAVRPFILASLLAMMTACGGGGGSDSGGSATQATTGGGTGSTTTTTTTTTTPVDTTPTTPAPPATTTPTTPTTPTGTTSPATGNNSGTSDGSTPPAGSSSSSSGNSSSGSGTSTVPSTTQIPTAVIYAAGDGSARSNIAAWGDSLTQGAGGIPWPTQIQSMLPGRTIFNGGVGGEGSTPIAARQGSYPVTVSLAGNTIPANGPVDIQTWNYSLLIASTPLPFPAFIGGVPGTVFYSSSGAPAAFTRTTPGSAVSVPASTQMYLDNGGKNAWINVLWMGRNSYANPTQTQADIDAVIASLTSSPKRFVVLSITNADSEAIGSAPYQQIMAINAYLAQTYPNNYLDIRSYLVNQYDPNYSLDVTFHSLDIPAASLRVDGVHLNTNGYQLVAQRVAAFIASKGW